MLDRQIATTIVAIITSMTFVWIWAAIRVGLVMSPDRRILGVKVPPQRRLSPSALASKSLFKKRNTKVLVALLLIVGWLVNYGKDEWLFAASLILPPLQILLGLGLWVQGRHWLKQRRRIEGWDTTATTPTTSDSPIIDATADHTHPTPKTQPSFSPIVYPRVAGMWFVLAFAVLIATANVLWLNWSRIPENIPTTFGTDGEPLNISAKTALNVFRLPLLGAGVGLILFFISYAMSTTKPKARLGTTPRTRARTQAALDGTQRALGMMTFVIHTSLALMTCISTFPAWREYAFPITAAVLVAILLAGIGMVLMIVLPVIQVTRWYDTHPNRPHPAHRTAEEVENLGRAAS